MLEHFDELDQYFRKETKSEAWHKAHPDQLSSRYERIPFELINGEKVYIFDFHEDPDMFAYDISIFLERRYTVLPPHKHKVPEITYIYSGTANYIINGDSVTLNEGDIVLVEPDVIHSASKRNENDIVVNIALREKYLKYVLTKFNDEDHLLFNFFIDSLNFSRRKDNYLIFRHSDKNNLGEITMRSLLYSYFGIRNKEFPVLLESYIRLMFLQLISDTYNNGLKMDQFSRDDKVVVSLLKRLEVDYKNCDLKSMAKEYGYSYSYFSTLIKSKCGYSFGDLKKKYQLEEVSKLLATTKLSIEEISKNCGFSNLTYFYQAFKEQYKTTPSVYRDSFLHRYNPSKE